MNVPVQILDKVYEIKDCSIQLFPNYQKQFSTIQKLEWLTEGTPHYLLIGKILKKDKSVFQSQKFTIHGITFWATFVGVKIGKGQGKYFDIEADGPIN